MEWFVTFPSKPALCAADFTSEPSFILSDGFRIEPLSENFILLIKRWILQF